jgi:N-acetyl sugar amidotransferase
MSDSMENNYRQCALTVMDNIADPDITFDEKGISNYYYSFKKAEAEQVFTGAAGEQKLNELVARIKKAGENKPYDCLLGLSGGVDSTYVAYKAKQLGLRPLAVHFDNGWNSELAVQNIQNIVTKLDLDLHTLVVDWEEFKDIQLAYIKASVIDIEAITDHAIISTLFRLCKKHSIKYVLGGSNIVTEYLMPPTWLFNKADHINLKNIHRQFGTVPLKTFPLFDTRLKKYCEMVLKTEWVSFLNYIDYNKKEVKATIAKELNWRDYGGKHYESIFTKFYQAYILPQKFNVDKRKPHLSNLICSGQVTKEEALQELEKPLYNELEFKQDYQFVLKKLDLTPEEFENLMKLPAKSHQVYGVETSLFERYPALKLIKPIIGFIKK